MSRSFQVTLGTSATPILAPSWINPMALPIVTQTASFTATVAMVGPTVFAVPYSSASPGVVTIPQNLHSDIGADLVFGQLGFGPISVVAGSGVTVVGQLSTLGLNHVIQGIQTGLNVWTFTTLSWNLLQYLGNPNGQPFLVSYGQITFTNPSAAAMLIDINPNIIWGGSGTSLPAAGTFTKYYGNGPAEIWYGVVQTTPAAISVNTGAARSA